VEKIPGWLGDFTLMRSIFTSSNDVVFNVYRKDMKSGEKITLGCNGQASYCVNYTLLAIPAEVVPEKVAGDVNADGRFDLPDLVLAQKYLLRNSELTKEQYSAADMDGDGQVNAFDTTLMRMELLAQK